MGLHIVPPSLKPLLFGRGRINTSLHGLLCKHTNRVLTPQIWIFPGENPGRNYKTALGNSCSQPEIETLWKQSSLVSVKLLISRVLGFGCFSQNTSNGNGASFQTSSVSGEEISVFSCRMKEGGCTQILIAATTWPSTLTSVYVKKH